MAGVRTTKLYILEGCPLTPDYKHTVWWISLENQFNYFLSKKKYTLNDSQYRRATDNSVKVPYSIGDTLNCNYLMFCNEGAYENKTYYAFITRAEYVADNVTQLYYEIDVMQTYYFDYELMPCFVEREHPVTDNIGENLLPEPVEIGEYVVDNLTGMDELNDSCVVVASTFKVEGGKLVRDNGRTYSNIYSGLFFSKFDDTAEGLEGLKAFIQLDSLLTSGSGIVSIFMMPKNFFDDTNLGIGKLYDKYIAKGYGAFDGYTPKNKKLFTYPFNYLYVHSPSGNANYHYEKFSTNNCGFYLEGDTTCSPGVMLTPINYNGSLVARDESLTITGFPQCAFSNDAFVAYLSQMCSAHNLVSTAGSVAQMAVGNPFAVMPIAEGGLGLLERAVRGNEVRGNSNNSTMFSRGAMNFFYGRKRIRAEHAKIIDNYFDIYGYSCCRVKVPERTSRPQWNYVKTRGCYIKPISMNSETVKKIQSIYDNGITFWCWGDNVGNYTLDNRPKT